MDSSPVVWIRVEGKGNFQISPGLKDFSRAVMAEGRRELVVDLEKCPAMDSTFMGTLAGIALQLRESGGGRLWVTNRNERNAELLSDLGLDALFCSDPVPDTGGCVDGSALCHAADKHSTREVMREAHEAAVRANPLNAARFKTVIEHLDESGRRSSENENRNSPGSQK